MLSIVVLSVFSLGISISMVSGTNVTLSLYSMRVLSDRMSLSDDVRWRHGQQPMSKRSKTETTALLPKCDTMFILQKIMNGIFSNICKIGRVANTNRHVPHHLFAHGHGAADAQGVADDEGVAAHGVHGRFGAATRSHNQTTKGVGGEQEQEVEEKETKSRHKCVRLCRVMGTGESWMTVRDPPRQVMHNAEPKVMTRRLDWAMFPFAFRYHMGTVERMVAVPV